MNALDHGMLNLPLAKRGDIDARIDSYKTRQAAIAESERRNSNAARKQAKATLAELLDSDLPAIHAARLGMHRADLVETLTEWAKWEPSKMLKVAASWRKA